MFPEMSSCCFDALVREKVYDSLLLMPDQQRVESEHLIQHLLRQLANALVHAAAPLDWPAWQSGFFSAARNSLRAYEVIAHPAQGDCVR